MVICAFVSVLTASQYEYDTFDQQYDPSLSDELDSSFIYDDLITKLSSNIVQNLISRIVLNIIDLIQQFVPDNAVVNVPTLLVGLKALGNPNVGELLVALFALVGGDTSYLWKAIPVGFLKLQLDGHNFLEFLTASIPLGTVTAPFSYIADLLGSYLSKLVISILALK